MKHCEICHVSPGVVETPIGEGSALACWPCAHAEIGDENVPVYPTDREAEARRLATVAAFEAAVRPCMNYLRGVALRFTRNPTDADDVLQEALTKAFLAWGTFDASREAQPWLSVIVVRCFISEWRRWGRRADRPTAVADRWDDATHEHEAWAAYVDAQKAIASLSPDHRAVLELAMVGTPYEEIASRLDVPVGTVMSRLHRARTRVEALL